MRIAKTEYGQTQLDIAVQETGDVTKLFELADFNGKGITDELEGGEVVSVPDFELDKRRIVNLFSNPANKPASGITTTSEVKEEGIEYWGIEIDFVVS